MSRGECAPRSLHGSPKQACSNEFAIRAAQEQQEKKPLGGKGRAAFGGAGPAGCSRAGREGTLQGGSSGADGACRVGPGRVDMAMMLGWQTVSRSRYDAVQPLLSYDGMRAARLPKAVPAHPPPASGALPGASVTHRCIELVQVGGLPPQPLGGNPPAPPFSGLRLASRAPRPVGRWSQCVHRPRPPKSQRVYPRPRSSYIPVTATPLQGLRPVVVHGGLPPPLFRWAAPTWQSSTTPAAAPSSGRTASSYRSSPGGRSDWPRANWVSSGQ